MRFGPSLRKLALVTLALIAHGAAGGSAALAQSPKEAARPAPLRIAVFVDHGTGESREKVIAALRGGTDAEGAIEIVRVKADEIRAGKLKADGISVLVHPGGSGSKQGEALGSEGREAVRDFVADGGGYLGICAGAYLATNDYPWSLRLIDARVVDRRHWARGKGPVEVALSTDGRRFFGCKDPAVTLEYAQGPLLAHREIPDAATPAYESLGVFQTEIARNGAPAGVMAGTSAMVRATFGRGRVFCFSPHPELTDGRGGFLRLAARWTAGEAPGKTPQSGK
ncbi:MAG: biofilm PGA synthesis protein PgaB [Verrucomicrobiae bacterium]|nr:biofilm PGA synthesis protein PgaB [Verrucomicrobiae bacterium]MCP5539004.1 biofilm PGA synthesis protein PgaB [Akkermansiaceae bacterium]MCP5550609.1 biofilm PGA synthesis protein PgaB [Akkermansiaceae bacterium]